MLVGRGEGCWGGRGYYGASLAARPGAQERGRLGRRPHYPEKKGGLARLRNKNDGSRGHPVSNWETTYHGQCLENFIGFLGATSLYE